MCTRPPKTGASVLALEPVNLGPSLAFQGMRKSFRRNEEIFGEGQDADYVYRVVSGAVRTMRFTQIGRRQILGFHVCGDTFGLEASATHSLTAEAIKGSKIAMVRRSQINKRAAEDAHAARSLLALMARSLADARDHALILGRKGASERVAAFLLRYTNCNAVHHEIDLPMPRIDIADYLALTIETVSRTFSEMERQHTIDLPTSRHVVMRRRSALLQLQGD